MFHTFHETLDKYQHKIILHCKKLLFYRWLNSTPASDNSLLWVSYQSPTPTWKLQRTVVAERKVHVLPYKSLLQTTNNNNNIVQVLKYFNLRYHLSLPFLSNSFFFRLFPDLNIINIRYKSFFNDCETHWNIFTFAALALIACAASDIGVLVLRGGTTGLAGTLWLLTLPTFIRATWST